MIYNNVIVTEKNAVDCCDVIWKYTVDNARNPNLATVAAPAYLERADKPSAQKGIPYCWGGFDGLGTSSSSTWSSFKDAMNKKKFAGNIKTNTPGYQLGTAGLDCSGFVSSVAGFSAKLGTGQLASSNYTKPITLSNRSKYDMYVISGKHVLYYVGPASGGIASCEATTSGDAKTKFSTRTNSWLSGYSLRRYNNW